MSHASLNTYLVKRHLWSGYLKRRSMWVTLATLFKGYVEGLISLHRGNKEWLALAYVPSLRTTPYNHCKNVPESLPGTSPVAVSHTSKIGSFKENGGFFLSSFNILLQKSNLKTINQQNRGISLHRKHRHSDQSARKSISGALYCCHMLIT